MAGDPDLGALPQGPQIFSEGKWHLVLRGGGLQVHGGYRHGVLCARGGIPPVQLDGRQTVIARCTDHVVDAVLALPAQRAPTAVA
ncbi:hypothetical protein D3C80_1411180 [compost metagenome]